MGNNFLQFTKPHLVDSKNYEERKLMNMSIIPNFQRKISWESAAGATNMVIISEAVERA